MEIQETKRMLRDICSRFPEIRSRIESHDEYMTTLRLEEFSRCTTDALADDDQSKGMAYLKYMMEKYRTASPEGRRFIDTYFVEALFWKATKKTVNRSWCLIPEPFKDLYVAFHGQPPKGL
jgi:hypothetical protein